jgi:adenosylcobinamide-GDP ribazoletransferase
VRPGGLRDGLWLAFGTLTVLPVPAPSRVDRTAARTAMLIAPLTALVPAAALAGASLLATVGGPPLLAAAVGVAGCAWLSRGLHLDGLADTADGLAASYDRSRALAVMRTGDVGPAGAATLVLVLLTQVSAVSAVIDRPGAAGAVIVTAAVVLSRALLVVACSEGVPAARDGGLGAAVAGSVPRPAATTGVALTVTAAAAALTVAGAPWWTGPVAAGCGLLAGTVLLLRCVRRLGGITGDVLGACVEVSLTATLGALAVLLA